MMRTMSLDVERILDGHQFMRNSIKDETGGLGVDCIVDNGGKMSNFSRTIFDTWLNANNIFIDDYHHNLLIVVWFPKPFKNQCFLKNYASCW